MAITAIVGLPGHGKSYTALELAILRGLKENRIIYTNIPLKAAIQQDFPDADLRLLDLDHHAENKHFWDDLSNGSLVVIDELWRIWPAGLKPSDMRENDLSFIKEHRHRVDENGRNIDIVLITQDLGDITRSIGQMVETTIICTQLTDLGMNNKFRRDYYRGPVRGFKGSSTVFIRSDNMVRYEESVYKYYLSHTKASSSFDAPNEKKVVSATIFQGLFFKAAVAGLFVSVFLAYFGFRHSKAGVDKLTKSPSQPQMIEASPVAPPTISSSLAPSSVLVSQSPPLAPPEPVLSSIWRVVGSFSDGGRKIVLLSDGRRSRRLLAQFCTFDPEIECIKGNQLYTGYSGDRHFAEYSANIPLNPPKQSASALPASSASSR